MLPEAHIKKLLSLMLTLMLMISTFGAFAEKHGVTILITCVGDCTLGGVANHTASSEKMFAKLVDSYGYDYFFKNVLDVFEVDDFTVINLEGPLTTAKETYGKANFFFRGRPSDAQIMAVSSIEVASLANNHIFNFGQAGFDETVQAVTDAGVGACGYDLIYYAECKGVTVGFVSFDQWLSTDSDIERVIKEARPNCDLLIVSYHGGVETPIPFRMP